MAKIKNAKSIHAKGKTHEVQALTATAFLVISGSSGKEYQVNLIDDHSATCTCDWGKYRKNSTGRRSACSHVQSVFKFKSSTITRSTSAWGTEEDARRQHRPIIPLGDGVYITTRKQAAQKSTPDSILADLGF